MRGAGLHGYDDKFIKISDRRAELDKVVIIAGGVIITPANSVTADTVSFGTIQQQADDIFTPDATNRDQDELVRW